jgi:putative effector of murein hydrolase
MAMSRERRSVWRNIMVIWVIGLVLGVATGAITAMLLRPDKAASRTIVDVLD